MDGRRGREGKGREGVNSLSQPLFWMLVGWGGLVTINRVEVDNCCVWFITVQLGWAGLVVCSGG